MLVNGNLGTSVAVLGALFINLTKTNFGEQKGGAKELKVTIPEALDYTEIFDDLFAKYTTQASLEGVKTTDLGSMFELKYSIILKDEKQEKALITSFYIEFDK